MIRTIAIAILFFGVTGCSQPTAMQMQKHLQGLPKDTNPAASREELIENIGYAPHKIREWYDCELWIWNLKGGEVEMLVCPQDGNFRAQYKSTKVNIRYSP